jgi:hypothetical protein
MERAGWLEQKTVFRKRKHAQPLVARLTAVGERLKEQILCGQHPEALEAFRTTALGSYSPGEVALRQHSRVLLETEILLLRHSKRLAPAEIARALRQPGLEKIAQVLIQGQRQWRSMGEPKAMAHYRAMVAELPARRRHLAGFFLREYRRNREGDYTDPVVAARLASQARQLLSSGRFRGRPAWLGFQPHQARQYALRIRRELPRRQAERVIGAFIAHWRIVYRRRSARAARATH